MKEYCVFAPECIPEIRSGDDLGSMIASGFIRERMSLRNNDILVLAHKIVSKAEGRVVCLDSVEPSARAEELANQTHKDPRLVELILRESSKVLWADANGMLICLHRLGHVCANAAIDCSNAGSGNALMLPVDPDASARKIRETLQTSFGCSIGVIICDTHGKAFREGACGTVIGASGVCLLKSYIGKADRDGRIMKSSVEAVGDELAGAATLLMGQGSEGRPLVVVRGLSLSGDDTSSSLLRPVERDIFLKALLSANNSNNTETGGVT